MTIAAITYQQVVDIVKNWIKANCVNIANFAGMDGHFKSGWTSGKIRFEGNDTSPSCYTVTLSGNAVSQVAASTVDTDMTNFLSSCGLTNLSQNIPASEFLDFIKNMVVFCSTKISLTASEYVSKTYIIYDTANTTYNDKYNIDTNDAKKMMLATDIIQIMNNIITLVRQNMRNKVVSYRVVMSL